MKGRLKNKLADARRPKSRCKQPKLLTDCQATASTLKLDRMEQKQEAKDGANASEETRKGKRWGKEFDELVYWSHDVTLASSLEDDDEDHVCI